MSRLQRSMVLDHLPGPSPLAIALRARRRLSWRRPAGRWLKMIDQQAKDIADAVVHDTQFWIAVIGILGVVVGSLATIGGNLLLNWLQGRKQKALDVARGNLLRQMLTERDWRKLSTLARVIGADANETRRLLIAIKA